MFSNGAFLYRLGCDEFDEQRLGECGRGTVGDFEQGSAPRDHRYCRETPGKSAKCADLSIGNQRWPLSPTATR